jgi:hypothetical protein
LLFGFGNSVEKRVTVRLDAKNAGNQGNVHKIWAQKKIAEFDLNFEKNRAELTGLGRQFGIVTRNTSLIVLETISDYIRYGIEPPASEPELLAEYRREGGGWKGQSAFASDADAVSSVPRVNEERRERGVESADVFGKGGFATDIDAILSGVGGLKAGGDGGVGRKGVAGIVYGSGFDSGGGGGELHLKKNGELFERIDKQGDVTEVTSPFNFIDDRGSGPTQARQNRSAERAERESRTREKPRESTMLKMAAKAANRIRKWWNTEFAQFTPNAQKYPAPDDAGGNAGASAAKDGFAKNNPYSMNLTGKTADDYQTYLKTRAGYASTPAFYFDMADWFYTRGDKETALRVLTSIADLDLENASLYRLLGYRLKEYGEYALEKFVCKKVVQWRPMEPQSYRDYALALADNGEAQAALDSLCSMLSRPYSENILNRSRGVEEAAVTEINRLIAKYPGLKKSKVDKRLLASVAVDVRVVINWNMNSTDIDLHVTDPDNEVCYYDHPDTRIGGRLNCDVTEGYGPEQFLLKNAPKGRYLVSVDYYGDRQATAAGPSTVMAEIYTKYAGKTETRRIVCLQMSNVETGATGDRMVTVAEFVLGD